MTKYRVTRIEFGTIHDDPMMTETDLGTITLDELRAMHKVGWQMVRHEDGSLFLNVDGLGWEKLHVCKSISTPE